MKNTVKQKNSAINKHYQIKTLFATRRVTLTAMNRDILFTDKLSIAYNKYVNSYILRRHSAWVMAA